MVKLNGRELPKDIELKVPVSTALYIVHIILIFYRLIFRKEYVEIKSRKTFTYLLKLKSMSFLLTFNRFVLFSCGGSVIPKHI